MSTPDNAPRNDAQTGSSRRSSPSTAAADLEPGALRHATSLAPQIGDKVRVRVHGVVGDTDESEIVWGPRDHEFFDARDIISIARAAYYDPSTEVAVTMKRADAARYAAALDDVIASEYDGTEAGDERHLLAGLRAALSDTSHGGASDAERKAPTVLVSERRERTVSQSPSPSPVDGESDA